MTVSERFLGKADIGGADECWEWTKSKFKDGYGQFWLNRTNRLAHRVAYELFVGKIPEGMFVCHSCDCPPCVNPKHLFIGTHQDNTTDSVNKNRRATGHRNGAYTYPEKRPSGGRHGLKKNPWKAARGDKHGTKLHPETVRGENNGNAKLTEQDILKIRHSDKKCKELSIEYKVAYNTILGIKKRKSWKHI